MKNDIKQVLCVSEGEESENIAKEKKIGYDERKREAWMSEYGKKLHSF